MTPARRAAAGGRAVGAAMFADALDDQAVPVGRVDWRPPEPGTEAALARVMADPRRAEANRAAVGRLLSAGAELVDVRPASEALGLAKGSFLHAGPPIDWERASGPMRGALIGAMLLEGLATTAEDAETTLAARRRTPRLVPPPRDGRPDGRSGQPVDVDVRAARPGARRHGVVLAERGPRQGAALRRLRAGGRRAAAVDGRRARAAAADRACAGTVRSTSRRSPRRCCRWATRATTATGRAR